MKIKIEIEMSCSAEDDPILIAHDLSALKAAIDALQKVLGLEDKNAD